MQNHIKKHHDFSTKIEDDSIALLEVIKILMHVTVCVQYLFETLTDIQR